MEREDHNDPFPGNENQHSSASGDRDQLAIQQDSNAELTGRMLGFKPKRLLGRNGEIVIHKCVAKGRL